jgi:hypothetical protein
LRYIQIATALEQAVRLNPDLEVAHHELGYLYGEGRSLDRALDHRRAELRLSRRAGPRSGESAEERAHRLELLQRDVDKLEKLVQEGRDKYTSALRALAGQRVPQAQLALRLGLTRQAADDILLPSPAALLGLPGIKLELEVLLSLGRADEVRNALRDEAMAANKQALPYYDIPAPRSPDGTALYALPYHWPCYQWLDVLQAAAVGDYEQAHQALQALRSGLRGGHELMQRRLRNPQSDWDLLGGVLSGGPPFLPAFAVSGLVRRQEQRMALQSGVRTLRAQQADLCVLEGLLALEQGATQDARAAFVEARRLSRPAGGTAIPFAGAVITGYYLPKLSVAVREARR